MNRYLPNGNVLFRFSRIHYKRWCSYGGYGSSLILIKGYRISVRAVTTYVVSLVEHVVAYVVEYFVLNFVDGFVGLFVELFVVVSCKYSCNILLWYVYCYERMFKNLVECNLKAYLNWVESMLKIL